MHRFFTHKMPDGLAKAHSGINVYKKPIIYLTNLSRSASRALR